MKNLLLIFSVLLSTSLYAQIGPDGTGTVNGYSIGPGADLSGAYLSGADLSNADLTDANLSGANLFEADLSFADLRGADLTRAYLRFADLSGANLFYANLSDTDLFGTIWSNAISQSDYDAVVAERDAALAAQATAEAERDARLTESEVRDLRLGSSMLEVVDGEASISIELEATDNLGITSPTWTPVPESKVIIHPNYQSGKIKIDVEADDESNSGVRFYRFKLDD